MSRLLMWLGRMAFLAKAEQSIDYLEYRTKAKQRLENPILCLPYVVAVSSDYLVEIWAKLIPSMFSGSVVILDRYVYDTVASDIAAHLSIDKDQFSYLIDLAFVFLPRPKRTYLLEVPETVSIARKSDIPDPEYLRERVPWYSLLKSYPEVRSLDGSTPIGANIRTILTDLEEIGFAMRI